jgi:hypothetical protein
VILATSGYVIVDLGDLGGWAQNLDLGPFEPHRPFVGWAAAITGALLLVAALTPRSKREVRRKVAPVDLGPPHASLDLYLESYDGAARLAELEAEVAG